MEEKKNYVEWCKVMEEENKVKILDDDGMKQLIAEGNIEKLLTKTEAFKYFSGNTLVPIKE